MVSKDNTAAVKIWHQQLGKRAEKIAANYLQDQGFQIMACNYRYQRSEIDLIVKKDGCLVFVEVKARTSIQFGYPEALVTDRQQGSIRKAAEHYIRAHNWNQAIRFDVIAIVQQLHHPIIRHFEDAFY